MSKTFLFRFDGARENNDFLEAARSKGHVVYAGLSMTLERGWISDFVEVVLGKNGICSMTLIELEATETRALVGARKPTTWSLFRTMADSAMLSTRRVAGCCTTAKSCHS